jgi:hypothetical protein
MKNWPDDKCETKEFEALLQPLVEYLNTTYNLERKDCDTSAYCGYVPIVPGETPDQYIGKHLTVYNDACEVDGRALSEEILVLAIRLGVEQGKRIARADYKLLGRIL